MILQVNQQKSKEGGIVGYVLMVPTFSFHNMNLFPFHYEIKVLFRNVIWVISTPIGHRLSFANNSGFGGGTKKCL